MKILPAIICLCLGGCITKTEVYHNGQLAIATRADVTNVDYVWADGSRFHADRLNHSTPTLAGGKAIGGASQAVGSAILASGIMAAIK